jgi:hypothetical protein
MGFGSYDESEQQNQAVTTEDEASESVDIHDNAHDGEVSYQNDASTDDLLEKLSDIKEQAEE